MADYMWKKLDNDGALVGGGDGVEIEFDSFITPLGSGDGYGGYNTRFRITNALGEYHVHFNGIRVEDVSQLPSKVVVINFKSSSAAATGEKIYHDPSGKNYQNLTALTRECRGYFTYPRHVRLLWRLDNAWRRMRGLEEVALPD